MLVFNYRVGMHDKKDCVISTSRTLLESIAVAFFASRGGLCL